MDLAIPTRVICFSYLDNLEIEIRPALLDLNPLFHACCLAWLQPLTLSALLPDDHPRTLSEGRATGALAKVWGASVIVGSPTDDELNAYSAEEWTAWLISDEHLPEFKSLREIAEEGACFVADYKAPVGEGYPELPAADLAAHKEAPALWRP